MQTACEEKSAKANAQLDTTSWKSVQLSGLLEARKVFRDQPADDEVVQKQRKHKPIQVESTSFLGMLAEAEKETAKLYNIETCQGFQKNQPKRSHSTNSKASNGSKVASKCSAGWERSFKSATSHRSRGRSQNRQLSKTRKSLSTQKSSGSRTSSKQ
eukprot:TRINITY_DN17790_c2_g1_i1.p2 TRINITY_DN17790_c2_g1~~TRINITY_DN17790_c2_g1_i1.p2  ORF type:complete len:157 (+),score=30.85 TRINITY_DN17790_c2_g1_i1:984-1454(+)